MPFTLTERPQVSEGATQDVRIDGTPYLEQRASDLVFSSVGSVAEVTTSDLTLGSGTVNVATVQIKRRTVAIGKAISFSLSGQQSGTNYRIRVTFTTSDSKTDVFDIIVVCV